MKKAMLMVIVGILFSMGLVAGETEELDSVQKKYQPKLDYLKKRYDKVVESIKNQMIQDYQYALKVEMKRGDLKGATDIQAKIDNLKGKVVNNDKDINDDIGGMPQNPKIAIPSKRTNSKLSNKTKEFIEIASKGVDGANRTPTLKALTKLSDNTKKDSEVRAFMIRFINNSPRWSVSAFQYLFREYPRDEDIYNIAMKYAYTAPHYSIGTLCVNHLVKYHYRKKEVLSKLSEIALDENQDKRYRDIAIKFVERRGVKVPK